MTTIALAPERLSAGDQRVIAWLGRFEKALTARDIDAATALFADECYWRDLVAFTWNITTQESKEQIADMLKATLADVRPSNWMLDEPTDVADPSPPPGSPSRRPSSAARACCGSRAISPGPC